MIDMTDPRRLFIFGYGFTSHHLAQFIRNQGDQMQISGTTRKEERLELMTRISVSPILLWDMRNMLISRALKQCTHLLISAGPSENGDPFLEYYDDILNEMPQLEWIGYLSTTAVYGDHQGRWVDENSELNASLERGKLRIEAEKAWMEIGSLYNIPTHIFRLSGIYGRGRNAFTTIENGRAKRVIKQGQLFNRIHAKDIAQTVYASIQKPYNGNDKVRVYNVADNEAAPPQDVITYASDLMGLTPPPEIPFEEADMTPMARSFYSESKKVRNDRIKQELGIDLIYPNYRDALTKMWEENDWK